MTGIVGIADVADEFLTRIRRNPGRFIFYVVGIVISVGIFTYSTIVASSSATAVANDFDELAATLIEVQIPTGVGATPYTRVHAAQLEAVTEIDGVVGVVSVDEHDVTLTSLAAPWRETNSRVPHLAVSGDVSLLELSLSGGDSGLLVGSGLASREGFSVGDVIEVSGSPVQIKGIVTGSPLVPQMLLSTTNVTPSHTPVSVGRILIKTERGVIGRVAGELPQLLNPTNPGSVFVQYDPDAVNLRRVVVARVDEFTVAIAAAVLAASTTAVGVSVFSTVVEQSRQLGLRRAIGATRRSLVVDVVTEVTGAGLFGAAGGIVAGLVVARFALAADGVGVVISAWLLAGGAGVGVLAAMFAALLPATRVARIQPVEALRAGQG